MVLKEPEARGQNYIIDIIVIYIYITEDRVPRPDTTGQRPQASDQRPETRCQKAEAGNQAKTQKAEI